MVGGHADILEDVGTDQEVLTSLAERDRTTAPIPAVSGQTVERVVQVDVRHRNGHFSKSRLQKQNVLPLFKSRLGRIVADGG